MAQASLFIFCSPSVLQLTLAHPPHLDVDLSEHLAKIGAGQGADAAGQPVVVVAQGQAPGQPHPRVRPHVHHVSHQTRVSLRRHCATDVLSKIFLSRDVVDCWADPRDGVGGGAEDGGGGDQQGDVGVRHVRGEGHQVGAVVAPGGRAAEAVVEAQVCQTHPCCHLHSGTLSTSSVILMSSDVETTSCAIVTFSFDGAATSSFLALQNVVLDDVQTVLLSAT